MKHLVNVIFGVSFLFMLMLSGCASSEKPDYFLMAEQEYQAQNFTKAIEYYQKSAAEGNAQSMNNLGFMYEKGLGCKRNYQTARKWYDKAVNKGLDEAKMNLGLLLKTELSEPVKADRLNNDVGNEYLASAIPWIKSHAENGNARAQAALSSLYYNGIGVEKDIDKSFDFASQSAMQDCAEGQYWLGWRYYDGDGCEKSLAEAKKWFEKAALQELPAAESIMYLLYWDEGNFGQSFYWAERAANQGWADALTNLGNMYLDGIAVTRDYAKARSLFEKAANQGNALACNNLGYMWEMGLGCSKNYSNAFKMYEKATATPGGHGLAEDNLGMCYYNGHGVLQDDAKARNHVEKAAFMGSTSGMLHLGQLYYYGIGGSQSYAEAKKWLEKAADRNQVDPYVTTESREKTIQEALQFIREHNL
ncbi:MAG: sel1 repeat family protein [Treponema sp.]|nr:sel1 repeat family protein [Treponema sp.]